MLFLSYPDAKFLIDDATGDPKPEKRATDKLSSERQLRVPRFLTQRASEQSGFMGRRSLRPVAQRRWVERSPAMCEVDSRYNGCRQASILRLASSSERNQLVFRHSSRNRPLKDSTSALSVGFPGRLKSSVTWCKYAH